MSSYSDRYDENSPIYQTNKRVFLDFLRETPGYVDAIRLMLAEHRTHLIVNINDLRQYNVQFSSMFLSKPIDYLSSFQSALKELVETNATDSINPHLEYTIGFDGAFGPLRLTPRELTSQHIGKLVQVEGIATRCSTVRPKIVISTHTRLTTDDTQKPISRRHYDQASLVSLPNNTAYPTKDKDGIPLTTEYGLSVYRDTQTLAIQEMPERAPAGLLPCSIDILIEGTSLCDKCKPGDRVVITGVFRPLTSKFGGETTGLFRSVILANNIQQLQKSIHGNSSNTGTNTSDTSSSVALSTRNELTSDDIANIHVIASRPDAFQLLSNSIAPSVQGHANIKRAILLMLLGGSEKNLDNGTHIRGDINVLMVGDPSTAKSQMLRYVLHLAPLAINTTGRGSSGAGLTAAVVSDRDTGERRLEAGAMVLADRGIVCIDEFDKMSDNDRVAIHEVMEQQTVTIAKAGIHMSLNSRCSVLAAANPIYGQYDTSLRPHVNIGLQDSLLSRFDLLFIVLDIPDPELDLKIATRVLNNHRYKDSNDGNGILGGGHGGGDDDDSNNNGTTPVFQKYNKFLHAHFDDASHDFDAKARRKAEYAGLSKTERREKRKIEKEAKKRVDDALKNMKNNEHEDGDVSNNTLSKIPEIVSVAFLKKYIQYAKEMVHPKLTDASRNYISTKYAELRQRSAITGNKNQDARALPVTARSLETLIRLSTAHAKSRLSNIIEESDCRYAFMLMTTSMDAVLPPSARIIHGDSDDDSDDDDSDDDDGSDGDHNTQGMDEEEEKQDKKSRKKGIKTEKGLTKGGESKLSKQKRGLKNEKTTRRNIIATSEDEVEDDDEESITRVKREVLDDDDDDDDHDDRRLPPSHSKRTKKQRILHNADDDDHDIDFEAGSEGEHDPQQSVSSQNMKSEFGKKTSANNAKGIRPLKQSHGTHVTSADELEAKREQRRFDREMREANGIHDEFGDDINDDDDNDDLDVDDDDNDDEEEDNTPVKLSQGEMKRLQLFSSFFSKYIRIKGDEITSFPRISLLSELNSALTAGSIMFTDAELDRLLRQLAQDGKVMYIKGIVYRI